jgi:hypothetical protein
MRMAFGTNPSAFQASSAPSVFRASAIAGKTSAQSWVTHTIACMQPRTLDRRACMPPASHITGLKLGALGVCIQLRHHRHRSPRVWARVSWVGTYHSDAIRDGASRLFHKPCQREPRAPRHRCDGYVLFACPRQPTTSSAESEWRLAWDAKRDSEGGGEGWGSRRRRAGLRQRARQEKGTPAWMKSGSTKWAGASHVSECASRIAGAYHGRVRYGGAKSALRWATVTTVWCWNSVCTVGVVARVGQVGHGAAACLAHPPVATRPA